MATEEKKDTKTQENSGARQQAAAKRRMPKWLRRTLKAAAWTVASVVALIIIALCLVVWTLTPARLTPIVERAANDYLNADVKIERAELTVWSTFPYAEIDLQGLDIRSRSLDAYKGNLPAGADSLLSVGKVHASFNLARIPLMEFEVRELTIDSPKANVVIVSDSVDNLQILPATEEEEEETTLIIRDIMVGKFQITNNRGLAYTDLRDGTSARIDTKTISLGYDKAKGFYSFTLDGGLYAKMPYANVDQTIPFTVNGDAKWDVNTPEQCVVRNLSVNVADIPALINADVKFDTVTTINKLDLSIGPVYFTKVARHIPADYRRGLDEFDTDFNASVTFHLVNPYKLNNKSYPTFSTELTIPDCYLANRVRGGRINDLEMSAKLDFNGLTPHKSCLTISRLLLDGFGIHIDVSGTATNLLKDPSVETTLAGSIDFAKVLKLIPEELPFRLSGKLALNTQAKFAISDFSVSTFHNIQVNGNATLTNIRYTVPTDSLLFFAQNSLIKFGTNSTFTTKANEKKNLLMASVSVDSLIFAQPGMKARATEFKIGAGCLGDLASLRDTSRILPVGARISIGGFGMLSTADSARVRMRNLVAEGSVSQFGETGKLPLLKFGIKADRLGYSDPTTFLGLADGDIEISANVKQRKRNRRLMAKIDSLCNVYPDLPRDSVVAMYMRQRRQRNHNDTIDTESYMDLALSNEFQRIFRHWDMNGSIKAKSGRFFTPYFPIRNRMDDLDIAFSTKKLDVNSVTYHAGKSDLSITGEVNNINSALLGSKRRPLTLDFKITSDMFDANELMAAAYRGSNFSSRADKSGFSLSNTNIEDDERMDHIISQTTEESDSSKTAIIIPKNIEVNIDLRNKRAVYSDFNLSDLHSSIRMKNGVLNVRDLSGKSTDGDVKLDLVYATANKNDIGLGMFLDMRDINVGRFMTLMPGLDTIMPMLKGVDGVINARLAATTKVDSMMNVLLPTTNAALNISGKNLVLLDSETFQEIAKMLRFKNKERNLIDSLSVEATAYNSQLDVYPFILRMDRYKLAVAGWNDFDTNYKYHISVLESPIFFKFGINLQGNFLKDEMKFRLGKAKLKEDEVARSTIITDTTKVNLFKQMDEIFRRGADAGMRDGKMPPPPDRQRSGINSAISDDETLSGADSLKLIEGGIIERPDTVPSTGNSTPEKKGKRRGGKSGESGERQQAIQRQDAIEPKNENND